MPAGVVLDVADTETVFDAAHRTGYLWPTVCGGLGTCRTCVLKVSEGADNCKPAGELEREGLATLGPPAGDGRTRLACQLRVTGPVVVVKRGVRRVKELRGL
ncbi:2Fe-2S iron-sulfur cluster-binding protein [Frankia sp. Cppng1_Ct_nod]|uniref:2Fe-2S iron-sulfur cluster-binding protein n=1 Tax=Frankia sp. Cppng1_Ct_nod TaxID=2897162 RepID=UPI001A93D9AA|nr:2Fe-2S iron-sulfur cluster-binding protein [Frankia sp. Cppng1_Ct_nod]